MTKITFTRVIIMIMMIIIIMIVITIIIMVVMAIKSLLLPIFLNGRVKVN